MKNMQKKKLKKKKKRIRDFQWDNLSLWLNHRGQESLIQESKKLTKTIKLKSERALHWFDHNLCFYPHFDSLKDFFFIVPDFNRMWRRLPDKPPKAARNPLCYRYSLPSGLQLFRSFAFQVTSVHLRPAACDARLWPTFQSSSLPNRSTYPWLASSIYRTGAPSNLSWYSSLCWWFRLYWCWNLCGALYMQDIWNKQSKKSFSNLDPWNYVSSHKVYEFLPKTSLSLCTVYVLQLQLWCFTW